MADVSFDARDRRLVGIEGWLVWPALQLVTVAFAVRAAWA